MKPVVYLLIALSFFSACSSPSYKIKGTIPNKFKSSKIEIISTDNKKLNETTITNNEFEIKGSLDKNNLYILRFPKDYISIPVFLENKNYILTSSDNQLYVIAEDDSTRQDKFVEFLRSKNSLDNKLRKLGQDYCNSEDMNEKVALSEQMDNIHHTMQKLIFDNIKEFKNTLIAHYIANDFVLYCERDYNLFTDLVKCFDGDNLNSPMKDKIFAKYEKTKSLILTGTAPDFKLNDIHGKEINLSSFRGNYVLLDFWASWCAPCRKKNKHLKKYYNEFKSKGMEFISVSLDNDKSKWIKAVKEDKLPWTQLADLRGFKDSEIKDLYKVQQVPTVFIIDPDGNIVKQNPSFEDIKTLLNIK